MSDNDTPIDVTLVIPSLLGPLPNIDIEHYEGVQWRRLPALETLLSRADKQHGNGETFEEVLGGLFGLEGESLPVAAITCLVDSIAVPAGREIGDYWWMRVDPVHLQADQAQLLLLGERMLQVEQQEADRAIESLNELYQDEGWFFSAPVPGRWYVRIEKRQQPQLRTTPLASVIGHDINRLLPTGADGLRWHGILTEIQMLLHSHAINQARMEQGKNIINSIWCWGEGSLPDNVAREWDELWSDEPLSRGLARLAGVTHHGNVADAGQWRTRCAGARQLVVLDPLLQPWLEGDMAGWARELQTLEQQWFAPLKEALATGALASLTLLPCSGTGYRVTRGALRRFWRRNQPLNRYLAG